MPEMMRYKRSCGHWNDQFWLLLDKDGKRVNIYCMACLFEKSGLLPCETYPDIDAFMKKYGGKKK